MVRRWLFGLVLIAGLAPAMNAFAQDEPSSNRSVPSAAVTLALPSARETSNTSPAGEIFRIGYMSASDPSRERSRLSPFKRHVEGSLNRPVEFIPFREARGLMSAMQRGQVVYGIGASSVFASLSQTCSCVEPIAMQPTRDGEAGVFAALALRSDASAQRDELLERLQPDDIIIVGEGSVVAHSIGISELNRSGISLPVSATYEFADSLNEAVDRVNSGDKLALLFWTRQEAGEIFANDVPAHGLSGQAKQALRIVWRSRPVPGRTHFVSTELGADLQAQLTDMITSLAFQNGDAFDALDTGSAQPFAEVSPADYQALFDALSFWAARAR